MNLSSTGSIIISRFTTYLRLTLVSILPVFTVPSIAYGQGSVGIDVEYLTRQGVDERLQSDSAGLLGDQIDPNTGSVVFDHVDVSIPGNFGLEVAIRRKRSTGRKYWLQAEYEFADWELQTPRISVVVGQQREQGVLDPPDWQDSRCTNPNYLGPKIAFSDPYWVPNIFDPFADFPDIFIVEDYEYSNGVTMEIPGQGSRQLLDVGQQNQWPSATEKVTTDNWAISCLTAAEAPNAQGEGFVATAPNGDQYTFDKLIYRDAPLIPLGTTFLERSNAIMLATSVTDVHGNTVDYNYFSNGNLDTITSSDGRTIKVVYNGNLISQVKSNYQSPDERVWNYDYDSGPSIATKLETVTLPDSREWTFDLGAMDIKADPTYDCTKLDQTVSVTHPNGATGEFTFSETRHLKGDSAIGTPHTRSCSGGSALSKVYFDAMSITQKTLSGPGYPLATWAYSYSGYTSGSVPSTKWGQEINPLGHKIISTYDRGGSFEGMMVDNDLYETASSGTTMQAIDQDYLLESMVGTTYLQNANQDQMHKPRREDTTTTIRETDVYTTVVEYNTTQSSTLYSHGFPIKITKSNDYVAPTRIIETTYAHDRGDWVLGLPDTISRNSKLFDSFAYNSVGRLTHHYRFGNLFREAGYHSDTGQKGAIAWVQDALAVPRRTEFDEYNRGLPELIKRADTSTLARSLDDNGWVTSETDGNGVVTGYGYTDMGWLSSIDRAPGWSDSTINYSSLGNGIVQTATRGPTKVTTSYDGLARPTLVKTEATSSGGVTSYVATDYDALSQITFTSFPTTLSSPVDGSSTTYDSLGRKLVEAENVTPFATTTYAYIWLNRTKVTDEEGHFSIYYHHAYGDPDGGDLYRIYQPYGISTYIYRNDYGRQYRVRQLGNNSGFNLDNSQYFYYDNEQRLCRHYTPGGGHKSYAYNEAYEVTSYAEAYTGGSGCHVPGGSNLVTLTYDVLGRLKDTDFADVATPDITRTYDDNSNLLTINRLNQTPFYNVARTYTYDTNNNIKTEQIGVRGRTYNLAYDYNAEGHLNERTFPSGTVIDYPLNGLGQVTDVKNGATKYAKNIGYHTNGALESATYGNGSGGNGHVLSTSWTPRQLPLKVSIIKGSNKAFDSTYTYNDRGQILTIDDNADTAGTSNDRVYGYDNLGRLNAADGPWGVGTFKYDPLSNLREKKLGSRTVTVSYDNVLNRATYSTDTGPGGQSRSLLYDTRGNATTVGSLTFLYDKTNQPFSRPGAASYLYDGHKRRTYQWVNGKQTYSIYDAGGELVHRHQLTDGIETDYVAAANASVRLENGTSKYTFSNHLGTPVTGTDSSGNILWRERYTPYGDEAPNNSANDNEPGFTGHVFDADSNLNYMQARYYDPVIGRFLSIDPEGFTPEQPYMFNRFAYTGNDPVNFFDPTGRVTVSWNNTTRVYSNTFDSSRSNGKTAVATPEQRKAAEQGKSVVAVTNRSARDEKLGFGLRKADGNLSVESAANAVANTTATGATVRAGVPSNAEFVIHGHIDNGPKASNGMVDDPPSNDGWGDTQSLALRKAIPTATVSQGDIGWHEIRSGQLTFEAPRNSQTDAQLSQIQKNLDEVQEKFHQ